METIKTPEQYEQIFKEIHNGTKRPACRLRLLKEPMGLLDSHLGGLPYCPHDAQLPERPDGQQLWLCAQINFAQMPPLEPFPHKGILQIFLSEFDYDGGFGLYSTEWAEQEGWRVVYYDVVDETVTQEEVQNKMKVDWTDTKPWRIPDFPLRIYFEEPKEEGISIDDYRFEELFRTTVQKLFPKQKTDDLTPYSIYDDCETVEQQKPCRQVLSQVQGYGCKMGGFPAFEQEDFRAYGEEKRKEWDILLLQIDDRDEVVNDPDRGLYLGGCGIANFWIRGEDLAKLDFSKVGGDWATT